MKRFHFRLQSVFDWRRIEADREVARLQALLAERQTIDRELDDLEQERQALGRQLGHSAALDSETLRLATHSLEFFTRRRAQLAQCKREADLRIDRQREQVLEARRRYELLEKLKQKQQDVWTQELAREEEKLAGELFLAQQLRGQNDLSGET